MQSVYFHYSIVIIYRQAQANTLFPVKAIIEGHWSAKVMRDGSDVRGSRKHQSEDRQVVDWTQCHLKAESLTRRAFFYQTKYHIIL